MTETTLSHNEIITRKSGFLRGAIAQEMNDANSYALYIGEDCAGNAQHKALA